MSRGVIVCAALLSATAAAAPYPTLLRGTVVGADGKPVEGASVLVVGEVDPAAPPHDHTIFGGSTVETDRNGNFEVVTEGYHPEAGTRLRAIASAPGWSASDTRYAAAAGQPRYAPVTLQLRPSITIDLALVDSATLVPIADATVTPPRGAEVHTTASGHAVFAGQDDRARAAYAARAAGYQRNDLYADPTQRVQRVPMRRLWPLRVRLLDAAGKPLAACHVYVNGQFVYEEPHVTGADGIFDALLPHDDLVVQPDCRRDVDHRAIVKHVGDQVHDVRLRDNSIFEGTVVDQAGAPVAGVVVTVRPVFEISTDRPEAIATTKTDARGHFRFDTFSADHFVIAVDSPPRSSARFEIDAGVAHGPIVLIATP